MAQRLRTLVSPAEAARFHMVAHKQGNPGPGDPAPSDLHTHQADMWCTYIHAGKALRYRKYLKKKKLLEISTSKLLLQ